MHSAHLSQRAELSGQNIGAAPEVGTPREQLADESRLHSLSSQQGVQSRRVRNALCAGAALRKNRAFWSQRPRLTPGSTPRRPSTGMGAYEGRRPVTTRQDVGSKTWVRGCNAPRHRGVLFLLRFRAVTAYLPAGSCKGRSKLRAADVAALMGARPGGTRRRRDLRPATPRPRCPGGSPKVCSPVGSRYSARRTPLPDRRREQVAFVVGEGHVRRDDGSRLMSHGVKSRRRACRSSTRRCPDPPKGGGSGLRPLVTLG